MKSDRLQDALGMIDANLISRAAKEVPKKKRTPIKWISAIAAVLVLAIGVGVLFGSGVMESKQPGSSNQGVGWPPNQAGDLIIPSRKPGEQIVVSPTKYTVMSATYPLQVQYPKGDHTFEQYQEWAENKREESRRFYGSGASLQSFFEDSISTFLSDCGNETVVYSPLNVYMALAMLAECGAGNTRQQILDLFNVESIEALRTQVHSVWKANYSDDGLVTSLLANSVWMNKNVSYREDAIQNLAEYYFASAYQGKMGSNGYNQALRQWLNDQTGGLLKDQIDHIELTPDTILALYSTIYFEASFESKFREEQTTQKKFYSPMGATSCDYMIGKDYSTNYYWGEQFSAASKRLNESGEVLFVLPDQGVSVQELLQDAEALSLIANTEYSWKNERSVIVNFEIPKFKVSSNLDLVEKLKALGVTDCFDGRADFSSLSEDQGLGVSSVRHGATVTVQEEGILGAAYTEIYLDTGMPPEEEVDFILNRPFIFVIRGADHLPLFVGVVNQI